MSESWIHINYVQEIVTYIKKTFPNIDINLLDVDSPKSEHKPSQVMGAAVPDVKFFSQNRSIIGEAKIDNDINNSHTNKQIEAYINYLRLQSGDRHLIFCSSMYSFRNLKNFFVRYKKINNINDIYIHVIDDQNKHVTI